MSYATNKPIIEDIKPDQTVTLVNQNVKLYFLTDSVTSVTHLAS